MPWVVWGRLALAVSVVAFSALSRPALADPGVAAPEPYRPSYGLVVPGAVVFAVSYLGALYWSSSSPNSPGCSGDRFMVLPLAGPFLTAASYGGPHAPPGCEDPDDALGPIATIDGVAQIGGALLVAVGLLSPLDSPTPPKSAHATDWRVAPVALGTSGAAVVVLGTF